MLKSLIEDVYKTRNIGSILRTKYALTGDCTDLFFYDPRKRLDAANKEFQEKSGTSAYRNIFDVVKFGIIDDLETFLKDHEGRKVAVDITPEAEPLTSFMFQENDLLIFGNERSGVTPKTLEYCDKTVVVPMLGKPYRIGDNPFKEGDRETKLTGVNEHTALNVSNTFSIVIYRAMEQLGYFDSFNQHLLFSK